MAYYLSQSNKTFLQSFLPILKATTETVKFETSDPARLIYILRNAAATEEYSWLRTKFSFAQDYIEDTEHRGSLTQCVVCKVKHSVVSVVDTIREYTDRVDLLDLVNYLIQEKPTMIRFTNSFLTEAEYERLLAYGQTANYTITKDYKGVTIISNG